MKELVFYAQIVVSALLIAVVLLQQQGVGLSGAFGGDGNVFRTKRGLEKSLVYATIVLGTLFLGLGLVYIVLT